MEIAEVIKSYNKLSKEKAEFVQAENDFILVKFIGKTKEEKAEKDFARFLKKLETDLEEKFSIEKIEKAEEDAYIVKFSKSKENPAEKILHIFGKYYEGTTPYNKSESYED